MTEELQRPVSASASNTEEIEISRTARWFYLSIGWFFLILGAIGAFLPVLPTVPFLLITAWAWAKSSKKLHAWLYSHQTYGPYLVAWDKYGVIPVSAKVMSLTAMTGGWLFVTIWVVDSWELPVGLGLIHLAVGTYIVTRPSAPPSGAVQD